MPLANRQGTTMLPLRDYPHFVAAVERIANPGSQISNLESQITNLESQVASLESRVPTNSVATPTSEN